MARMTTEEKMSIVEAITAAGYDFLVTENNNGMYAAGAMPVITEAGAQYYVETVVFTATKRELVPVVA